MQIQDFGFTTQAKLTLAGKMYRSNGNPEGYGPTQAETTTHRYYVTLGDGSMEGPWSKIKKVRIKK